MIGLSDFRVLLGAAGEELSDQEVKRIRDVEYGIADAMFESWLRERNAQVFQEPNPSDQL
jgi:hypothetical protein